MLFCHPQPQGCGKQPAAPKHSSRDSTRPQPRPAGTGESYRLRHGCGGAPPRKKGPRPPPRSIGYFRQFLGGCLVCGPLAAYKVGGLAPRYSLPPLFLDMWLNPNSQQPPQPSPPGKLLAVCRKRRTSKKRPAAFQGAQVGLGSICASLSFPFLPRSRRWRWEERRGGESDRRACAPCGRPVGPDESPRLWMVKARAQPPAAPHTQKRLQGHRKRRVVGIEPVFGRSQDGASCNCWQVPQPASGQLCGLMRSSSIHSSGCPLLELLAQV